MAASKKEINSILLHSFLLHMTNAKSGLGDTQREWSRICAGEILYALGIDEHEGIKARKPVLNKELIEGESELIRSQVKRLAQ